MMRVMHWILGIVAVLLVAPGLALCGLGVYLAVLGPRQAEENYAQVRGLPVLTAAADLEGLADGQRVLVSGRVADESTGRPFPLTTGGTATFVAYDIYRYDRSHGPNDVTYTTEVREEHVTPPLALQLAGGTVRVVNRDYHLARAAGPAGAAEGGRRVVGHVAGGAALADATVVRGADGPALRARTITAAGPDDYIRGAQPDPDSVGWAKVFGFAAGVIGGPLVVVGLGLGAAAFGLRRA